MHDFAMFLCTNARVQPLRGEQQEPIARTILLSAEVSGRGQVFTLLAKVMCHVARQQLLLLLSLRWTSSSSNSKSDLSP